MFTTRALIRLRSRTGVMESLRNCRTAFVASPPLMFPNHSQRLGFNESSSSRSSFHHVQRRFWSSQPILSSSSNEISTDVSLSEPDDSDQSTTMIPQTNESFSEEGTTIKMEAPNDALETITAQRSFLIDGLARNLTRNVRNVIERIDRRRFQHATTVTATSPTAASIQMNHDRSGTKQQISLMDRWTTSLNRERRRHQYRRNDDKKNKFRNMTIEERWSEALHHSNDSLDERSSAQWEALAKPSTVMDVSPLFHFSMEENGRFPEGSLPDIDEANSNDTTVGTMSEEKPMTSAVTLDNQHWNNLADGVLQALVLFETVKIEEWRLIGDANGHRRDPDGITDSSQNTPSDNGRKQYGRSEGDDSMYENEVDYAKELLDFAKNNTFMLASTECNLILAHILCESQQSQGKILARSLLLFNEMNKVRNTGLDSRGPDSTTYRLLFLGLTRRLSANGEAAQICKGIVASRVDLDSDTILEAMNICHRYSDLETASALMEKMLAPESEILPTLPPCLIHLDILMDKNMMKEALLFYECIKESHFLSKDKEDMLLFKISDWPRRSRRGDKIDCTEVLLHVMHSLFEASGEDRKPQHQLWFVLLERLADASRLDPSLEIHINRTIRRMLDVYPETLPSDNLMRIGLRCAQVTKDAGLIAQLIDRALSRSTEATKRLNSKTYDAQDPKSKRTSLVPQLVFRKALEIAMQNKDFESMVSIFKSFSEVAYEYPLNARSDCFGLMVRGYILRGRIEMSQELLMSMVEEGLQTPDGLFGEVLQGLVVAGKPHDAHTMFNEMKNPGTSLPAPGASCYNAIVMSYIQNREWEKAISTFKQMKPSGIAPNAESIQGYLLAQVGRNGKLCATGVITDLLREEMPMDEDVFLFVSRLVLPGFGGKTTDEIRRKAREMGECQPLVRDVCLQIVTTARSAQDQDKKAKAKLSSDSNQTREPSSNRFWNIAVSSLLELATNPRANHETL